MGTVLLLTLLGLPIWAMWTWNRLIALRAAMRAAWASTDALLKRRADLIPNLVAVVKDADWWSLSGQDQPLGSGHGRVRDVYAALRQRAQGHHG